MKNLYKILCCSMLLAAQSLVAAPNWSNPITIYSTPDSSRPLSNALIKTDSSGNGVALYPTTYGINAFGGSAQLTAQGVLTYPANNTPLATGSPSLDHQLNRVVSVSQSSAGTPNNNGNALAAWVMYNQDIPNYLVQAELLTASANSWGNPTILTQNSQILTSNITTPQIYLQQNGTGIALWTGSSSGSGARIYYSTFDGTTWATDAAIGTQEATDPNPILLDCPTGNPMVVFLDTSNQINICSFNGTSWSSIAYGFPHAANYGLKAAAMSSNGITAAAWIGAYLTSYKNGALASTNINTVPTELAVAVDNNQNATYAYIANNGSYYIQSLCWMNSPSDPIWSSVTDIQTGAYFLCNLSMQTDSAGNIFAVWESDDENNKGSIWFSYCPYSNIVANQNMEWTNTIKISEQNDSYKKPQLSVSPNGTAIITWIKNGTTIEAITTSPNLYQPQTNWFECVAMDQPL